MKRKPIVSNRTGFPAISLATLPTYVSTEVAIEPRSVNREATVGAVGVVKIPPFKYYII